MKKRILSVLTVAALLLILVPPVAVMADTEGSVDGEFGINVPPTVDSVSLTDTAVTPHTEYVVTVQVSDADTIDDLATVVLKLWYDSDGGTPTEGEFSGSSANVKTCAIVTWTHTSGTSSTTVLTPTTGGSTWALGAYTVPTTADDFSATSFGFSFPITIGKVATETTDTAKWQVMAQATDSKDQIGSNYDAEGAVMNWYGEITVPTTTVSWGDLAAGTEFDGDGSKKALGVTVSYLSNGTYDQKVKSGDWTGASNTATLDLTGTCTAAQQFALKANDATAYSGAVLVDTVGATIATEDQTTESGKNVTANNIWIKLASTFAKDVYHGTITYIIANGG